MRIAVFGATGKTGIQVVRQALNVDYGVKAFVRNSNKMIVTHPKLEVVQGDILDAKSVDRAIEGVDVVISALGSREPVLAEGTKNIINSMKKHGAKRLIVESSYSYSGSPEGLARMRAQGRTEEEIAMRHPMIDDKASQEKFTRESGLEWIIVRPLALTGEKKTGKYRIGEKLNIKLEDHISRADVADFMLKSLKDDKWLGKTIVISY